MRGRAGNKVIWWQVSVENAPHRSKTTCCKELEILFSLYFTFLPVALIKVRTTCHALRRPICLSRKTTRLKGWVGWWWLARNLKLTVKVSFRAHPTHRGLELPLLPLQAYCESLGLLNDTIAIHACLLTTGQAHHEALIIVITSYSGQWGLDLLLEI